MHALLVFELVEVTRGSRRRRLGDEFEKAELVLYVARVAAVEQLDGVRRR